MVNFKLGEEIRKDGIFNMSRAWDKEKKKKNKRKISVSSCFDF